MPAKYTEITKEFPLVEDDFLFLVFLVSALLGNALLAD